MKYEKRLRDLEKKLPVDDEPVWIVVVYEGDKKATDKEIERLKAEYIRDHPNYKKEINVISVVDEHCKEMTLDILAGKMPDESDTDVTQDLTT